MNKIINILKFEIYWSIQTFIENVEYQIALWNLAWEDWFYLMTASKDDPKFNLIYGTFWNGALNLDINDYNMFID